MKDMHEVWDFSNADFVRAFNDGAVAFREGQPRCIPSFSDMYATAWMQGWDDAFNDAEEPFNESMLPH